MTDQELRHLGGHDHDHVVDRIDLRIATADEFAAVEEEGAEAIAGTLEETLISEACDAMLYGDGGAGKTTLGIDLSCHLAAGDEWIGIEIPKPVRVLFIENEGPRPRFRAKLRRKLEAWSGSPLGDRLLVLENPWGGFTYADSGWRQALADVVREHGVDVVFVGPLTASGMEAAGTLQETRDFLRLVDQARELAGSRFASILIHHENRGGKVSGAWEGTGDTLLHLQQMTHGRHRLTFQKARWSSALHGTNVQLVWAPGEAFELADREPDRSERTWDDIAAFVLEHGGCSWNDVNSAVTGEGTYLRRRRDQMLADGLLVNAGKGQAFKLWHRDDPARRGHLLAPAAQPRRNRVGPPTRLSCRVSTGASATGDGPADAVGSTSPDDPEIDDADDPAEEVPTA